MRYILKKSSPLAFEKWKVDKRPTYWYKPKGYPKHKLREALLIEQGHLCCYCQQRIENEEKTVIEHFYPRNGADKAMGLAKMFDYDNLFAACDGGAHDNEERNKRGLAPSSYPLYCDKEKGFKLLPLSPLEPTVEVRFKYVDIGLDEVRISPTVNTDQDAIDTIGILNLDTPKLKNLRGQAIAGLIYQNGINGDYISIETAQHYLTGYESNMTNSEVYLPEFLSVKIYFLRSIISQTI